MRKQKESDRPPLTSREERLNSLWMDFLRSHPYYYTVLLRLSEYSPASDAPMWLIFKAVKVREAFENYMMCRGVYEV